MNHRATRLSAALSCFILFAFATVAHAAGLPVGWSSTDIGAVGVTGSASASADTFTVAGAGADVWGTSDEFRFTYARLTGDGDVMARVSSVQAVDAWTKAGVMMRESLTAGSKHVFMLVSPGKGPAFQRRTSTGGTSANTGGGSGTAPAYVRLTRAGSTFTAYCSTDGRTWTRVGSASITMASTIYVGLAVSSHVDATRATASFSQVAVSQQLSSGWHTTDVGWVGTTGSASGSGSSVTVNGAGADVWGSADQFRFTYTTLAGDGQLVTRVSSLEHVSDWTKAGVMMRDSLATNAKHAFMLVSAGKGLALQYRASNGGSSANVAGGAGGAGQYVKLVRSGSTFTAYKSADGSSWTRVGSASISMGSTIYVGVAVSSHVDTTLATAGFSGATVTAGSTTSTGTAGGGTTTGGTSTGGTSSTSGTTLRLVHWNLHHGVGTDGKYDINRIADWIVKMKPDVVSLNEVEKNTYWGNENQPARYESMLESKTGVQWYAVWAQEFGDWSSNGKGNLLLSRFPLTATARYELSYDRTVALGQVVVNGRNITVATTHLDPDSGSRRVTQAHELAAWFDNFAESRILAGDLNAQPTSTEMNYLKQWYVDAWQAAKNGGFAYSASDNPNGYTRNSRIDFVFTSKGASPLTLTRVEVVDTRSSTGVMPSDHRPIVAVYSVK